MGQELLHTKWEKKPRLYFKATNSRGLTVTRGSAQKKYAYCVIEKEPNKWGYLFQSWASTEALGNRYLRQLGTDKYELVKAEVSSAKEVRLIKKQMQLKLLQIVSEGKNLGGNTDDNNN